MLVKVRSTNNRTNDASRKVSTLQLFEPRSKSEQLTYIPIASVSGEVTFENEVKGLVGLQEHCSI